MLPLGAPACQAFPLALLLVPVSLAQQPAQTGTTALTVQAARKTLARFEKGDPGWQVRMQALVALARGGPVNVPVLVEALKKGSPSTREFAAQALAFFADPRARQPLEAALDDPDIDVRFHACAALSMFGRLAPTERYLQFRDSDHWAVRRCMAYALARDDKPDAAALLQALAKYDLAAVGSARLAGLAPNFTLGDLQGNRHRLSDFRGKKGVLLIFLPIA
jgi:HEAT repeat protein